MRYKTSIPLLLMSAVALTASVVAGQPSTKPANAPARGAVPQPRPTTRPAPRAKAQTATLRPAARPASQPTAAMTTAKAFLGQYMAAFLKGDVKTMMALYHNSASTRSISSRGDDLKGYQAIQTMFTGSFNFVRFTKALTSQVQARRFGTGLLVYARFAIHSTMKQPPHNRFILRSQGTLLLQQHNGRWVIAHEHFSPIMGLPRIEPLPPKQLPPSQDDNDNNSNDDEANDSGENNNASDAGTSPDSPETKGTE